MAQQFKRLVQCLAGMASLGLGTCALADPGLTTSANGSTVRVLESFLVLSPATSALWQIARQGGLQYVASDALQIRHPVDAGVMISKPQRMPIDQVFRSIDHRIDVAESVFSGSPAMAASTRSAAAAGAWQLTAGFGTAAFAPATSPLSNPYLALVPNPAHVALAEAVGPLRLRFAVLTSGQHERAARGMTAPSRLHSTPQAGTSLIDISSALGDGALQVALLQTSESDAYLGTQSGGALTFGDHVTTRSMQLALAWPLSPTWVLAGQAAYGSTPGHGQPGSLISRVGDNHTNAFSAALVGLDRLVSDDRLTVSLTQPIRTYAGNLEVDVVGGVSDQGNPQRVQRSFSMVPQARELLTQLLYQAPLGATSSLGLALTERRRPNNLAGAESERAAVAEYQVFF